MNGISLTLLAVCLSTPAMAGTPIEFSDTSYREADGHRIQQLSVVVEAPVGRVWKAFTTDAGFVTWATPFAHITLANGGMMETSYKVSSRIGDPDNIKNRIDCYLPEKLLVIHNEHVPKGAPFDPVLIASLRTIITFEALGADKTRVSEAQVGYGDSPGYETMYRHFRSGNEEELRNLAQSFISGPIDWKAEAAAAEASVRRTSSK